MREDETCSPESQGIELGTIKRKIHFEAMKSYMKASAVIYLAFVDVLINSIQ